MRLLGGSLRPLCRPTHTSTTAINLLCWWGERCVQLQGQGFLRSIAWAAPATGLDVRFNKGRLHFEYFPYPHVAPPVHTNRTTWTHNTADTLQDRVADECPWALQRNACIACCARDTISCFWDLEVKDVFLDGKWIKPLWTISTWQGPSGGSNWHKDSQRKLLYAFPAFDCGEGLGCEDKIFSWRMK